MTLFNDDFYMQRAREAQHLRERLQREEECRVRRAARQAKFLEYRRAWWPVLWLVVAVSGFGTALWIWSLSLDAPMRHQELALRALSVLVVAGTVAIITACPPEETK